MNRAGYIDDFVDDLWYHIRWRGAVASAIRGKRGQAFLRELVDSLESMDKKELVSEELQCPGGVCALGRVAQVRGIDWSGMDPFGNNDVIASELGIADALAREIEYVNDYSWGCPEYKKGSIEDWERKQREWRWTTVHSWACRKLGQEAKG